MSAGSACKTERAAGGWPRPGSSRASRRSFMLATSGGCDPKPSIRVSPLKREGEYTASMKTGAATFGSQPWIALGSCDGIGAQRRFMHIRKVKTCLRLEAPRIFLRKMGQAIYG